MIDFGLLVSMIIAVGIPTLLARRWPLTTYPDGVSFLDVAIGPIFAGLIVGRLTTLALDDPSSIGSVSDMLIIRSGVEFWPGVVAATAVLVWGARRAGVSPIARLADVTPLTMVGYAGFEAGCIFRDGCYGPESAIGLQPPGLTATMLPLGLFMAAAVAAAAIILQRSNLGKDRPVAVILAGVFTVAAVRAIGSIWLPRVGEDLTRQHLTSVAAVLLAALALAAFVTLQKTATRSAGPRTG